MATIPESQAARTRPGSSSKLKRYSIKPDMTPMVDLGFLLIAFFVMTAEMNKPAAIKLNMPKDCSTCSSTVRHSNALTLLIGAHKMHYYIGDWEEARATGEIHETGFSVKDGIGKVIRGRQAWLSRANSSKEGSDGLIFLIKPGPDANYQQVIDAIDETQINGVKKYMILSPEKKELTILLK